MTIQRANQEKGFTLIEMLMVLAIVMVLAALLFAVFSRVRENGRKATCQSNLKQLALAIHQYVQDNDGRYAPTLGEEQEILSPYVKSPQIYFCPSQNHGNTTCDYAFNIERLNRVVSTSPYYVFVGRREAELTQTATIWLQRDNGNGAASDYEAVSTSCGREEGSLKWHFDGANYSFLDGHVKWLTPQSFGEIECSNPPLYPSNP